MNFQTLLYAQGFIVAVMFTIAVVLWYRISNENPTLYKCRKAINFVLLISFILVIKAFQVAPDPQNIRQILQHSLTAVASLGFFFEIKKVYKKNILRRKKELGEIAEPDSKDPLKVELYKEVIKPELKRLEGLRNLIKNENEILEKKKTDLETWENKLHTLKGSVESEKNKLKNLNKELYLKEKELQTLEESLKNRKKSVERKEKNYGKRDLKLEEKRKEIITLMQNIKEEKEEINKNLKTMKLLEEDIKDQKSDIQNEREKLEQLKK